MGRGHEGDVAGGRKASGSNVELCQIQLGNGEGVNGS